jgi:hypothetical protein
LTGHSSPKRGPPVGISLAQYPEPDPPLALSKPNGFHRVIGMAGGQCGCDRDTPFPGIMLALCSRTDIGGAVRPWILKLERTRRWAAERAAVKAEVKRAKKTVDLLGIARAITRLDALEAEIEAVEKTEPANRT